MGDSAVHRPPPTATGTLAKTPVLHLLLYVLERKLSGTLELLAPDKRNVVVTFVAGRPAKVRTSEPVAYLGRVLLELGFLDDEQLTRSLADLAKEKAAGRKLHGEVLVAHGMIDEAKLAAGLREQVGRKLRYAAGLPPETAFGYFEGFDQLSGWGREATEGFDPYPVLWTLLREFPPWDQVTATLERISASALRLRGTDVDRLGLTGGEAAAAALMRARPLRASEIAKAGQLNDRTAQLLAYLLLATRQADVVAATAPSILPPQPSGQRPDGPAAPPPAMKTATPGAMRPATPPAMKTATPPAMKPATPPAMKAATPPAMKTATPPAARSPMPPAASHTLAPPPGLSPELSARWKEITERATSIDRADYFSMLDVARDVTPEEVETAYFALAKVWHPDRLPADLAPVRDSCSRVFARMSEARATLVDPKQRERYLKLVAEGSGSPETQETVARVVEASTHFQKAEVCFKRNDPAQAEEFCRKALELDDSQPDYHALLAWLIALKPDYQTPDKTLECIRMLDRAIQIGPRCEKAHYWRGMLYKRLGKNEQAAKDFKKVADINPRNIDAAREVRLFNMRGGGRGSVPPPAPSKDGGKGDDKGDEKSGGLLGRFFKKT